MSTEQHFSSGADLNHKDQVLHTRPMTIAGIHTQKDAATENPDTSTILNNLNLDLLSESDELTKLWGHKQFFTSLGPNVRSRRSSAAIRMQRHSIVQHANLTQTLMHKRKASETHGRTNRT